MNVRRLFHLVAINTRVFWCLNFIVWLHVSQAHAAIKPEGGFKIVVNVQALAPYDRACFFEVFKQLTGRDLAYLNRLELKKNISDSRPKDPFSRFLLAPDRKTMRPNYTNDSTAKPAANDPQQVNKGKSRGWFRHGDLFDFLALFALTIGSIAGIFVGLWICSTYERWRLPKRG